MSAIETQLMTGVETVYGTPVATDRGVIFLDETLELTIERIESAGLRRGSRVQRDDMWGEGARSVTGDINMEVATKGQGRWWHHCLGTVASAQPDAAVNPTVYRHTFTPGKPPVGMTIQVGRPDDNAVVVPFTYHGCKVSSWALEAAVGAFAKLKVSILGEDEDTGAPLATVNYPVGARGLTFVQGTLKVATTELKVKNFSLQASTPLAEDRYNLGSALREDPKENGLRTYTGTLSGDFRGLTAYQRFVSGQTALMELLFQGATISGALKHELKVSATVRFDGKTPNVGGQGLVQQELPYKVVDDGTLSIKVEYQTTDTTP